MLGKIWFASTIGALALSFGCGKDSATMDASMDGALDSTAGDTASGDTSTLWDTRPVDLEVSGAGDAAIPDPLDAEMMVTLGGKDNDGAYDVAMDASGNFYVAGHFTGIADFTGTSRTSVGHKDAFVASLDTVGKLRWVQTFGGAGDDRARGLALDAEGNVYVTGQISDRADFGAGTRAAVHQDIFVASYTSNGALRWAKVFAGGENDTGRAAASDGTNVYVTGTFRRSLTIGSDVFPNRSTSPDYEGVLFALDATTGTPAWARRLGSPGSDFATDVAVDGSGRVVVVGTMSDRFDFGGGMVDNGAYVARYDSAGTYDSAWAVCSAGRCMGSAVAVGVGDAVFTAMQTRNGADFGTGMMPAVGSVDAYLVAYDGDGTLRFVRSLASNGLDHGVAVSVDPGGDVVVGAHRSGVTDLGGTPYPSGYLMASFVATDGSLRWATVPGPGPFDRARMLSPSAGVIVVALPTFGAWTVGSMTVRTVRSQDALIARLRVR